MRILHPRQVRLILVERRVRKITKFLISNENQSVAGVPILLNDKIPPKTRLFQLFVIVACLVACIYQTWSRLAYYMSNPTRMNVFYEEVNENEMPMLTLCTRDTEEFLEYLKSHSLREHRPCYGSLVEPVGNCNVSVDKLWNLLDTKSIIRDAFIAKSNRRLSNLTFGSLTGVAGICRKIFSEDQQLPFGDPTMRMHILLEYPELKYELCPSPLLQATVQLKNSKLFNLPSAISFAAKRKVEIVVETLKYEFLNKTTDKCVDPKVAEECIFTCYNGAMLKNNSGCKLPYEESVNHLPYCKCSSETAKRNDYLITQLTSFTPYTKCQCTRSCSRTELVIFVYTDVTEKDRIEIYTRSNMIRKIVEERAYGIVALLCDIGGNFSLYLGLSVLSVANLVASCVQFQRSKRVLRMVKGNLLQERILSVFKSECEVRGRAKGQLVRGKTSISKIESGLKLTVLAISAILCIYQMSERVVYYFSYPTSISITVVDDKNIQLPAIITCFLPPDIFSAKEEFARRKNMTCDNVEILDLLDEPSNFAQAVERLWDKTSTIKYFMKLPDPSFQYGNWSSYPTTHGICTKSEIDVTDYGVFVSILTIFYQLTSCGCSYTVFIVPVGDPFDLRHYLSLPRDGSSFTRFVKRTQKKVNTPKSPCVSGVEANACKENCFKNKMMENITCKLPFMSSISLPFCNSSQSAKRAKNIYLNAYMHTNPFLDCSCYPACKRTIYLHHTQHDYPIDSISITAAMYSMRDNVREIIAHNLAFSFVKLLCDIGSNLGVMLGMSLLSLANSSQSMIYNSAIILKSHLGRL